MYLSKIQPTKRMLDDVARNVSTSSTAVDWHHCDGELETINREHIFMNLCRGGHGVLLIG